MAYAVMRLEKVKSSKELTSRYNHNMRVYSVENADPSLTHLNREPVDLNGKTYLRAYEEEIQRMKIEGAQRTGIKRNAVMGFEIMLSYSWDKDGDIPLDQWIEKNVEWLQNTFNPKDRTSTFTDEEGKERTIESDNVKSVVVHMDEATPHIHAFVVPIDERGHLNARRFTEGRDAMRKLQTDYAKAMEEFGLERGTERTKTRHQDVTRYYQGLKEAVSVELPEPEQGESVQAYKLRADEVYRNQQIQFREEMRKMEKRLSDARAGLATALYRETDDQQREGREITRITSELGLSDASPERLREARRTLSLHRNFEEAKETYPDKERLKQVESDYREIANSARKRKKSRPDPERPLQEG